MLWKELLLRTFKALPSCLSEDAFDASEVDHSELECIQADASKLEECDADAASSFAAWAERHVEHPGVRRDLVAQARTNIAFAWEMAAKWCVADGESRADIAAFHESDGPEMVRQAKVKHIDGVPTVADLERDTTYMCARCGLPTSNQPDADGNVTCSNHGV